MKMNFKAPKIELLAFEVEDIVTTSGLIDGGADTGDGDEWGDIWSPNT